MALVGGGEGEFRLVVAELLGRVDAQLLKGGLDLLELKKNILIRAIVLSQIIKVRS